MGMRRKRLDYPNLIAEQSGNKWAVLRFDKMSQGGLALKRGMRGVKTVQNTEGSSLTLRRKKLSVKDTILNFYISCLRG